MGSQQPECMYLRRNIVVLRVSGARVLGILCFGHLFEAPMGDQMYGIPKEKSRC